MEDAWILDETQQVSTSQMRALGLGGKYGWVWKAVRVAWHAAEAADTALTVLELSQLAWRVVQRERHQVAVDISRYEILQRAILEANEDRARHLANDPSGHWHWYYHHIDQANELA